MITVRKYKIGEEKELRNLYSNTIRKINIRDYSPAQIKAWASDDYAENKWNEKIRAINPFVALYNNKIVGYADVQVDGYIDHFYCHHNYQRKGIGKYLMIQIFETGKDLGVEKFYSKVSKTAKPFFEYFGFKVVKEQQLDIRGEILINYLMEKVV